jgi:hypothetical protein
MQKAFGIMYANNKIKSPFSTCLVYFLFGFYGGESWYKIFLSSQPVSPLGLNIGYADGS